MDLQQESMNIAVLAAHPDDAEIWCGGTIAKHVARGDHVRIFGMFQQESGRVHCAMASAEVLGATYCSCSVEPRGSGLDDATFRELVDFSPQLVLTHWQHDSHPEHVEAYRVAQDAVIRLARASVYVRAMFSFTTYYNRGTDRFFIPEFYVDVSPEWSRKVRAINLHVDQDPEELVADASVLFAAHGRVIGAAFAEVFAEVPIFGRLLSRVRSPDFLS